MPHPFAALEDRLLKEGVAFRHVRRYIGELRVHLDVIAEGERRAGASSNEAHATALQRLGSEEVLAEAMLARPELRAFSARYPALAFGLGPLAALALIVAVALITEAAIVFSAPEFGSAALWRIAFDSLNAFVVYGAPVAVAAFILVTGLRQRIPSGWVALGLGATCVLGSFHHLGVAWSPTPDMPSQLSAGFGLFPPFPAALIADGLIRLCVNVSVAVALWLLLRHAPLRRV